MPVDLSTILAEGEYLRRVDGELVGDQGGGRFVPVFIFNGESNSGGQAFPGAATAHELGPRPEVQIFDNAGLASYATLDIGVNNMVDHSGIPPEWGTHGWELGLANSVENGEWWDDVVYLIKTGQGGSTLSQWNEAGTYWTKFLARTRSGLSLLRSQGKIPIIYVWYSQGINDANQSVPEATWVTETKAYHARLRRELGFVPIFMTKLISAGAAFNDSIDAMAVDDNMLYPIEVTGATTGDEHHWDYAGMKLLAQRMVTGSKLFGQHEQYLLSQNKMLAGGAAIPPASDLPSIIRSPSIVSFVEGSAGGTFTVRLSAVPAATVTVTVGVVGGGNVSRTPATLTFTTGNYATDQTVTLTSTNDGTASGNRSDTVNLTSPDVAAAATVGVTVIDAQGGATAPVNTTLPAITGATTLAAVLTCSTGTWTQSPTGYTYQWKRAGSNIAGQTASTHTIVAADQGTTLTCEVTATNPQGSTAATTSGVSIPAGGGSGFGGTLTAATWGNFLNAASSGAGEIHLTATTGWPGAMATQTVDLAQPWEIEVEFTSSAQTDALVIALDHDAGTDYTWGNATLTYIIGLHNYQGQLYTNNCQASSNIEGAGVGSMGTFPCRIKMTPNGANVDFRRADGVTGGGAYGSVFYTRTGYLTGFTSGTAYVKALFGAALSMPKSVVVRGLSS